MIRLILQPRCRLMVDSALPVGSRLHPSRIRVHWRPFAVHNPDPSRPLAVAFRSSILLATPAGLCFYQTMRPKDMKKNPRTLSALGLAVAAVVVLAWAFSGCKP